MSDISSMRPLESGFLGFPAFLVVSVLLSGQTSCVSKNQQDDKQVSLTMESLEVERQNLLIQGGPALARAEAGQGLVWFPFVWGPVLTNPDKESGLTAIESLSLRDPKLILRNTQTKSEIFISLREESGIEGQRFELFSRSPEKQTRFYLPRVVAVSQGDYVVEGIRVEISTQGQERGTLVNMPFVNPFPSSASKPLVIKVREGRIATVARVAQSTFIAEASRGLSLKTVSENIDFDVIPVGLVLQQTNRTISDAAAVVVPGTSDFPLMRVDLTNGRGDSQLFEPFAARIGFLVDAPCQAEGSIRMVWKRQNDEREYLTQFPVNAAPAGCVDKQSLAYSFAVPKGDWLLKSTMISSASQFQPQIQTAWLRTPSGLLKDYFSLSDNNFRWTLETQKEREIRRALVVPVDSASRKFSELRESRNIYSLNKPDQTAHALFMGHFEIRSSESKLNGASVWDFVLKSSFDLKNVQSLLSASNVYNAYTLEQLNAGRSSNTNIVLRTAADQEDRPSVAPVASELQAEARKAYAVCVKEREETDPLVNLSGTLQFTVLKGSDGVNLKSPKSDPGTLAENWLEACLKKKFIGFRFSRRAPANFQGELRFGKDN